MSDLEVQVRETKGGGGGVSGVFELEVRESGSLCVKIVNSYNLAPI